LVVNPIVGRFQTEGLLEEQQNIEFGHLFSECQFDQLVVSLFQELNGILISHLKELEVAHDLGVDNSEVIIDCLIEDQVVADGVQLLILGSQSLDSVVVDIFQDLIDLFIVGSHLLDQGSQELYKVRVVVIDTEIQAVE